MDKKRLLWILIAFLIGFFLKFIIENLVCQNMCPLIEGTQEEQWVSSELLSNHNADDLVGLKIQLLSSTKLFGAAAPARNHIADKGAEGTTYEIVDIQDYKKFGKKFGPTAFLVMTPDFADQEQGFIYLKRKNHMGDSYASWKWSRTWGEGPEIFRRLPAAVQARWQEENPQGNAAPADGEPSAEEIELAEARLLADRYLNPKSGPGKIQNLLDLLGGFFVRGREVLNDDFITQYLSPEDIDKINDTMEEKMRGTDDRETPITIGGIDFPVGSGKKNSTLYINHMLEWEEDTVIGGIPMKPASQEYYMVLRTISEDGTRLRGVESDKDYPSNHRQTVESDRTVKIPMNRRHETQDETSVKRARAAAGVANSGGIMLRSKWRPEGSEIGEDGVESNPPAFRRAITDECQELDGGETLTNNGVFKEGGTCADIVSTPSGHVENLPPNIKKDCYMGISMSMGDVTPGKGSFCANRVRGLQLRSEPGDERSTILGKPREGGFSKKSSDKLYVPDDFPAGVWKSDWSKLHQKDSGGREKYKKTYTPPKNVFIPSELLGEFPEEGSVTRGQLEETAKREALKEDAEGIARGFGRKKSKGAKSDETRQFDKTREQAAVMGFHNKIGQMNIHDKALDKALRGSEFAESKKVGLDMVWLKPNNEAFNSDPPNYQESGTNYFEGAPTLLDNHYIRLERNFIFTPVNTGIQPKTSEITIRATLGQPAECHVIRHDPSAFGLRNKFRYIVTIKKGGLDRGPPAVDYTGYTGTIDLQEPYLVAHWPNTPEDFDKLQRRLLMHEDEGTEGRVVNNPRRYD